MTNFLAILAFYYLCDASAVHRVLDGRDARHCAVAYESIKGHFRMDVVRAPLGTAERRMQDALAYRGFKLWERENEQLVAIMKRDAARRASSGLSARR